LSDFAIGIDTGGTFTDGVVLDIHGGEVLSRTKVITRRHRLSISIGECLKNLIASHGLREWETVRRDLRMVSISTTLATNSIVEGQGAEVGLILIGFDLEREVPTSHTVSVPGGCDIKGKITTEIDAQQVKRAIGELRGRVESFAVSGYMSVRNPSQELQVGEIIREQTGCPVVCAHELSGSLGMYERTVTCVLNARLIPLVTHLVEAVHENLEANGVDAPLMVVKGDGSLISEQAAMARPVETVLSGPAASVVGATFLSRTGDGIVVDMGGTTTDIAVVRDGKPELREEGAEVGGWLTRVKAAEITTIGLGGDSFIQVSAKSRTLSIGPQKVFPLSWVVSEHPHLLSELKQILASRYEPLNSQPTSVFVHIKDPEGIELTETERSILEMIRETPHTLWHVARKLGRSADIISWERLVTIGSIHRANLTPTDILHVRGDFRQWSVEAATLGVEIMAHRLGVGQDAFIERFFRQFSFNLFCVILGKLLGWSADLAAAAQHAESLSGPERGVRFLFERMFARRETGSGGGGAEEKTGVRNTPTWGLPEDLPVKLSASSSIPLIAVGAPVNAYFPDVAERLDSTLIIPEAAEVANAVGTVNGRVEERVRVLLKPGETGGYFVYTPGERRIFRELDEAFAYGERTGREEAMKRAAASGAHDIHVSVERKDKHAALSQSHEESGHADRIFIESVLVAHAVGTPWAKSTAHEQ